MAKNYRVIPHKKLQFSKNEIIDGKPSTKSNNKKCSYR